MRKNNFLAQVAACAAGLGLLLPSGAVTAAVPQTTQSVRQEATDVVLTNGTLTGQFITAEGTPVDGAVVSIRQGGREVTRATTDAKGVFHVPGMKAGVYEVATPGGLELVRVWDAETAPPTANQYATIVSTAATRAQACDTGAVCGHGGVDLVSGAALAVGIAGLATGVVGITRARDARRDTRRLRADFEEAALEFEDDLAGLQAQIDDLQAQIDAIVSP